MWGISDTVEYGTITDANEAESAAYEPCETQQGAVDGIVIYDTETKLNLTVIANASGIPPAIGDTLTIGSVSAIVLNVEKGRSHKGKKKYTIQASKWKHLVIGGGE